VAKILQNRAVLGEYQPHVGRGKNRKPDGEPISNYYPTVISQDEWDAAQGAKKSRELKGGRPAKRRVNLFSHLLRDAWDKSPLHFVDKGGRGNDLFKSSTSRDGVPGSRNVSFPADVLERALLSCLKEIKPKDILPPTNGGQDKLLTLTGRLAELDTHMAGLKARLDDPANQGIMDIILEGLRKAKPERDNVAEELAQARQEAATPLAESWGQAGGLIEALAGAPDQEAARLRLRKVIRRVVESIWCFFVAKGHTRAAVVQIFFTGGKRRDYVIGLVGGHKNVYVRREPWWEVASMRAVPEYAPMMDLRTIRSRPIDWMSILEQNVVAYVLEGVLDLDRYRAGKKGRWIIPPDWIVTLMRIFEYVDPGDLEVHRCHPTS
jgi:hypothetical protein